MYRSYEQLGEQPEKNRDILNVVDLANIQHKNHIISTNRVVCVDIYADWCGPCKQTASTYSIIAATYTKPGECAVVKYNWDKLQPPERKNINGIPLFQFFLDGKQVDQVVGADMQQVEDKIKNLLQHISSASQSVNVGHQGPVYNRNSIRQNKSQMPQMEASTGQPYQANSGGNYHQPYQSM